jgi:thiamine pyrophosphokinase
MSPLPPTTIDVLRPSEGRRRHRAAVLALTGATRAELGAAIAWAARFDRRALLVAVDGGLDAFRAARRRPDLFVGDLDSARGRPGGVRSSIYPVAKDFNDFSGGLAAARDAGAAVAVVAGLLGGRLDHEWANLLEAGAAARDFAGIFAPSSRGLLAVTAVGVRARTVPGRLVSVFALGGAARVSLRGTVYTLSKRRLSPGSLGLSNVTGKTLELDVHRGVALLVFPKGTATVFRRGKRLLSP